MRRLYQSDVISSASELLAAVQQARCDGQRGSSGKIILKKPVRLNWSYQDGGYETTGTFSPHDLRGADLSCIELDLADLRGADLTNANLNHAVFRRSLLCDIEILEGCEFIAYSSAGIWLAETPLCIGPS